MIEQETVDIKDAAGLLNVSMAHVEQLLKDGELRFCLVSGKQLIRIDDVLNYKLCNDQEFANAMQGLICVSDELGLYNLKPRREND
ncbi:MAG: hypothetical protein P4L33_07485 [Capsulimonadaceae bacterium]|nr:hypothetical protein [Capsulimonadaceae bacterium]